ncbi:MAG: bifunctional (p)ppGpp synthetase/guanosine-3',5'-bis(diphosphate) 3'-pyrophosphohydrolase [Actinobacteria bacterium]|nr:bifunctional (p)ppGpp synthetase/guanosine-3',5'-bis(diphosphate) 3'-pyrophosphohydrolase [Actinomycetota bacterium]
MRLPYDLVSGGEPADTLLGGGLAVESQEQVKVDRRGGLLGRLRSGDGHQPVGIDALLRAVKAYNPKADLRQIERAFRFAETSHAGQKRKSGEDFIEHPLGVAMVLADLRLDTTTLVAALLHDVVEDTDLSLEQIEREFGEEVGRIVDGLTKLDRIEFRTREHAQAENVRKMIVAMAKDIRVLLIKLADRLHNMRTLHVLSAAKQKEKAGETLEIYAPLADRLGVHRIKWELEDLAFAYLHPKPFEEIGNLVEKREGERQEYLERVLAEVRSRLRGSKLRTDVQGRPKHLYSVYEKMVLRGKEFNEIFDLVGIRVLVDSVRDCYAALGAIHSLWKPVPGRFKDYIAMPKFNMYQSLHTSVIGPEGRPLEIQIRTHDMHRAAEYGIAAHWRYKERQKKRVQVEEPPEMDWLRRMLEWQQDMSDPREFMEGLRVDLYQGQVFVFTPKGDVVNLPDGATPIDFAYHIHTEVGHRCIGAKVGGKLVPLDYALQTGDTVEILTSRAQDAGPSRDWLKNVHTPRARSKIRQWFSRERREDALDAGRDLLQRLLRKQGVPFKRLATDEGLSRVAADLKYPDLDSLYVAIGGGHVSPQSVVARLARILGDASDEGEEPEIPLSRPVRLAREPEAGVVVPGVADVWVRLARCCTPVPGDDIVGFVTRGQGVSVHRTDCPNVGNLAKEPDRMLEVSWRPGKPTSFVVSIQVEALDRQRLLGDVATVLGDTQVNILSASSSVGKDRITKLRFTFELADIAHLSGILSAVKKVENVYDAYRVVPR